MLTFYNTLTKQKEKFKPLKDKEVRIYNCGPTVYDRQHIGNLRSAVIWDVLRRVLEWNGYNVKQAVNITDFGHLISDADEGEDKMAKGLRREGLSFTLDSMKELGQRYTKIYLEDRKKLNTLPPTYLPIASEHVEEDIELIKILEEKGYAYITNDGVYFDTSKANSYGKLGGLTEEKETRIGENPEKKNSRDFALWKFNRELGWSSPWGQGFPGWHVECSAMSKKYLGETFDIHTGGIEHIPIHHNNEIVQSESANDKPMANYWLHNEHLIMRKAAPNHADAQETSKMAKSEGNVIYLKDVEEKGYSPIALRLLFLQSHYRSPIEFSWQALEASQNAYDKLTERVSNIEDFGMINQNYLAEFTNKVNNDLDTAGAVALTWDMLRDDELSDADKKTTIFEFDKVLGLGLDELSPAEIPEEVRKLASEREEARESKDFDRADELRKKIEEKGFDIKDTNKGPRIVPASS